MYLHDYEKITTAGLPVDFSASTRLWIFIIIIYFLRDRTRNDFVMCTRTRDVHFRLYRVVRVPIVIENDFCPETRFTNHRPRRSRENVNMFFRHPPVRSECVDVSNSPGFRQNASLRSRGPPGVSLYVLTRVHTAVEIGLYGSASVLHAPQRPPRRRTMVRRPRIIVVNDASG